MRGAPRPGAPASLSCGRGEAAQLLRVVHVTELVQRGGYQDDTAEQLLPGRAGPPLVEPGHRQRRAVGAGEVDRLLAPARLLGRGPLVPAVGGKQAAPGGEGAPVRGLVRDRLHPSVDHPGAGSHALGPRWRQSPAEQAQPTAYLPAPVTGLGGLAGGDDRGDVVGGSDVEVRAQSPAGLVSRVEQRPQLRGRPGRDLAPAHAAHPGRGGRQLPAARGQAYGRRYPEEPRPAS